MLGVETVASRVGGARDAGLTRLLSVVGLGMLWYGCWMLDVEAERLWKGKAGCGFVVVVLNFPLGLDLANSGWASSSLAEITLAVVDIDCLDSLTLERILDVLVDTE